jgi:hypothetical protein
VVILDSLSHAWNGPGGVLEIVEQASKKFRGNSYAGWQEGTPAHNSLIEGVVSARTHIIATMRSKQEYILVERNGKQAPQKVGMAPVQRDGFEYEFDVFIDMDIENNAIVSKTRCPALTGKVMSKPGADLANTLREWLSGEPALQVEPKPQPKPATNGHKSASMHGFTIGDAVEVKGKKDVQPGTINGFNGELIVVTVNGEDFNLGVDRLTKVNGQPAQDDWLPEPEATYQD